MSNFPVSLIDNNGMYNNFIYTDVIPKLLDVIAESGLSFKDAKAVPKALDFAINSVCEDALAENRFALAKVKTD